MFEKIVSYLKGAKPDAEKDAAVVSPGAEGNLVEEKAVGEVPAGENEKDNAAEGGASGETTLSNTSVIVEAGAASDKEAGFQEKTSQKSWFARLKERLGKTKNSFMRKLGELFGDRMTIDEQTLERLEEILIEADIGVKTTQKIIKRMQEKLDEVKVKNMDELFVLLRDIMTSLVDYDNTALNIDRPGMSVMLVVGVNGVGKTTTIGKIASNLVKEGKKVMIVAGDTFRAGAIEQAEIWARRVGIPIVKAQQNSDPAAVVFDAIKAGNIGFLIYR
jgi:fused signal recognition particle receptor